MRALARQAHCHTRQPTPPEPAEAALLLPRTCNNVHKSLFCTQDKYHRALRRLVKRSGASARRTAKQQAFQDSPYPGPNEAASQLSGHAGAGAEGQ
jgi:hypothetical protein